MFPRTVKTALVAQLRDEIIRGNFVPGERLRLEDLAERFEVSTMPIREALSALESEGLVVIRPHRGAHVTSFTAAELSELYEIRAVLEQLATLKAVPHLTPADLNRLQELVDQMQVADGGFDVAPFSKLNMAFHQVIYDRAGMPQLSAQIRDLRFRVQHYLHKHLESTNYSMTGNSEHQRLIDLIRDGNAEAAGDEMYHHILGTGLEIAEIMKREERVPVQ